MLFNSSEFLIFFPIVTLIYFILPKKIRQYWLLISSYYFYMCWNAKYLILILFSTTVTFVSGLLLEKINNKEYEQKNKSIRKNIVVAASFILSLSVLFYYKYANFTFSILAQALSKVHINLSLPQFDVILPVGISFFTFQALSYTMDVYRGEIGAEKNFFKYALFVSFFPQLVAGPIERSKNLLKQISEPKSFEFERTRDGILLMLWGYFLKMVLADRIAVFVDTVYGDVVTYSGYYIVVATVLFAFQIYCDFAGYSVIAMGTAKILGIELMDNFASPYLSVSVAGFWRRWHISLTSWFKDYLYIPLGGNQKGKLRKNINKMIVFVVSGLWHGASTSFVIWGGLNGLYQVIGENLQPLRNKLVKVFKLNRDSLGHKLLHIIGTFILVDFSWIFFRAESTKSAFETIKYMVSEKNPWIFIDGSLYDCGLDIRNFWLMIYGIGILLIVDLCKSKGIAVRNIISKQDIWFRWLAIDIAIIILLVFGIWGSTFDANNFIYFQF